MNTILRDAQLAYDTVRLTIPHLEEVVRNCDEALAMKGVSAEVINEIAEKRESVAVVLAAAKSVKPPVIRVVDKVTIGKILVTKKTEHGMMVSFENASAAHCLTTMDLIEPLRSGETVEVVPAQVIRRMNGGPTGAFLAMVADAPNWTCTNCGEKADPHSPDWRWSGEEWQHHHGLGHSSAERKTVA